MQVASKLTAQLHHQEISPGQTRQKPTQQHSVLTDFGLCATAVRPPGSHLSRDLSDRAVAKVYQSAASELYLTPDGTDNPSEFLPQTRWLMLADIALIHAREEQQRIKAQIRPHVERYKRLTGNKK
jgi:hypothetical protein